MFLKKYNFLRYITFFDYYLEIFAKNLSGRGLMNPEENGEFNVMKNIILNKKKTICFIDGGSNIGEHIIKFNSICKKNKKTKVSIFAIEPHKPTIKILKKRLKNINYKLISKALGDSTDDISFFSESRNKTSGKNSCINHFYLNKIYKIKQTTINEIIKVYKLSKIDYIKLDIEGFEYKALMGAKKALSKGMIDYISLEYNQTWIEGGGTINKVLKLAKKYSYKLYRIRKNDLLEIPSYNFILDDFFYCNLLLVRNNCKTPLPVKRKAIPVL